MAVAVVAAVVEFVSVVVVAVVALTWVVRMPRWPSVRDSVAAAAAIAMPSVVQWAATTNARIAIPLIDGAGAVAVVAVAEAIVNAIALSQPIGDVGPIVASIHSMQDSSATPSSIVAVANAELDVDFVAVAVLVPLAY